MLFAASQIALFLSSSICFKFLREVVPPARLELALPKEPDFESGASTNSTTGAAEGNLRGQ